MKKPIEIILVSICIFAGLYCGYQAGVWLSQADGGGGRRYGGFAELIIPLSPFLMPLLGALCGWRVSDFVRLMIFREHYKKEAEKATLPEDVSKRIMLQAFGDAKHGIISKDDVPTRIIELCNLVHQYRDAAFAEVGATGSWEALQAIKGDGWVEEMFETWIHQGKIKRHD